MRKQSPIAVPDGQALLHDAAAIAQDIAIERGTFLFPLLVELDAVLAKG
jgi:hypothetical protein